jgi:hypothetical protein
MPPSEGAAPTDPAPFTEPAEAMAGPVAMPEPQGGLLPAAPSDAAMMPPASIKTASDQEGLRELQDKIRMMNNYR